MTHIGLMSRGYRRRYHVTITGISRDKVHNIINNELEEIEQFGISF